MSCCNHELNRRHNADFREHMINIPFEAFCCVARVAYSMARNAYVRLHPAEAPVPWSEMTKEARGDIAQRVRETIVGTRVPAGEFDMLVYDNIITLSVEA